MKLSRRVKKIIKWVGYPAFFMLCFLVSLVMTFPYERIEDAVKSHFKKEYDVDVTMDSISGSLPLGIEAQNVVLMSQKPDALAGILPLVLPHVEVNVGIFSMLFGSPSVDLVAGVFGGDLTGSFSINQAAKFYRVTLKATDLKMEQMSAIKNRFKELPVKGLLGIKTDLALDLANIKNSNGFLEMTISDGVMGPGKWTFELPLIRTGSFNSRFVLSDGKLEVEQFEQTSPDMMSDMVGSISLAQSLGYSRVSLDYRFKIADHLLEKYDIFKLALSAIRNAEGSDGYFYHTFRGALTSMKPVPNKAAQYKFRDKERKIPDEPKAKPERPERSVPARKPGVQTQPAAPEKRTTVRKRPADARRVAPPTSVSPSTGFGKDKGGKDDGLTPAEPPPPESRRVLSAEDAIQEPAEERDDRDRGRERQPEIQDVYEDDTAAPQEIYQDVQEEDANQEFDPDIQEENTEETPADGESAEPEDE